MGAGSPLGSDGAAVDPSGPGDFAGGGEVGGGAM